MLLEMYKSRVASLCSYYSFSDRFGLFRGTLTGENHTSAILNSSTSLKSSRFQKMTNVFIIILIFPLLWEALNPKIHFDGSFFESEPGYSAKNCTIIEIP